MDRLLKIKYITPILIYLGVMLLADIVVYGVIYAANGGGNWKEVMVLMNKHPYIPAAISAVAMIFLIYRKKDEYSLQMNLKDKKMYLLVPLTGMFANISISFGVTLLRKSAITSNAAYGNLSVSMLVSAIVLMPVVEELLFRGIIYERMQKNMGVTISAFCSTILFAVMHMGNMRQILYSMAFGLLAVLIYELFNSNLMACILLHATANLTAIGLNVVVGTLSERTTVILAITTSVLFIIMIFVIVILTNKEQLAEIRGAKKERRAENGKNNVRKR